VIKKKVHFSESNFEEKVENLDFQNEKIEESVNVDPEEEKKN